MASIKKVTFTYKKAGLHKDSSGAYVGYQVDVRLNNKRHRNVFPTRKQAEQFIAQLNEKRAYTRAGLPAPTGTVANVPIAAMFAKRLKAIKHPKEVIRATRIFKAFENVFDSPVAVTDVRSSHFQIFINERLDTGIKPQSVHREITILSTAFKTAAAAFPVELEGYEPPRIPRPVYRKLKKRRRIITEREKDLIINSIITDRLPKERAIRTNARPVAALMFELAWMLGLRYSEVTGLLKTDFNPDTRTLRVVRWKTGDVSLLEFLPARVIDILQAAIITSDSPRIFDLPTSQHTFADILRKACEANGIKYGRAEIDGVVFHSTRHSFTTRLIRVTDPATAASFTGHSSKEMLGVYSHADDNSRRDAMARLYGGNNLQEIYDKVVSGEMDFEEFQAALRA